MYTHVAQNTGQIAALNALRNARQRHTDLTIPWCTFCVPEVAHVGLQVWEARELSIPIKTYTIMMQDVDRAITDRQENGFVKLHVAEGKDRILGATIVASRASEMINEICVAMHTGIGLRALARVVHTYPSQSAAIRLAALSFEEVPDATPAPLAVPHASRRRGSRRNRKRP
jgi:pyruvate/2-oxoglutarate dehydrogenase complex dihydrolipoamide dehydrogenase (E3) component